MTGIVDTYTPVQSEPSIFVSTAHVAIHKHTHTSSFLKKIFNSKYKT